jgi:hypothetical protein
LGVNLPCGALLDGDPVLGVDDPALGLALVAAFATIAPPPESAAPTSPPASIEPAMAAPTTAVRNPGIPV